MFVSLVGCCIPFVFLTDQNSSTNSSVLHCNCNYNSNSVYRHIITSNSSKDISSNPSRSGGSCGVLDVHVSRQTENKKAYILAVR